MCVAVRAAALYLYKVEHELDLTMQLYLYKSEIEGDLIMHMS